MKPIIMHCINLNDYLFSNSMQNITVIALKKGKVVESHTCTFDSNRNNLLDHTAYKIIYHTEIEQLQCGSNVTKLQFKR